MKNDLWEQVRGNFEVNDGSLPGIAISNLSPAEVSAVYAMLRKRSRPVEGAPAEFWFRKQEKSELVDSVPDATALVTAGVADSFHHCVAGIVAGGVELPVLGIFVDPDAVELDYRMGPEWNPATVRGFFELLRDCCAIALDAKIKPAEVEGPLYPERFVEAWSTYCSEMPCDGDVSV